MSRAGGRSAAGLNKVSVVDGTLVVEPVGLGKLWSLTRAALRVPLAHVRGATWDPGVAAEPRGLRAPGLSLPGRHAGTFHRDGERLFWNLGDPRDNVVVELVDERYDRLVLTVADPRAVERLVNDAVAAARRVP